MRFGRFRLLRSELKGLGTSPTGRFRKRAGELDVLENANLNWTLIACSPRSQKSSEFVGAFFVA